MPKVDLKLSSTAEVDNKKMTTTISDVNPSAGSAALLQMAQKINALTTNTYNETNRVETVNLDTEEPGGGSTPQRTITVTNAQKGATAQADFTRVDAMDSVNPKVFYYITETSTASRLEISSISIGEPTLARYTFTIPNYNGTLYIGTTATNAFLSTFISVSVSS